MTQVLLVGVGHPDRGDDAAGWLVADRVAELLGLGPDGRHERAAQAAPLAEPVRVVRSSGDPSALLLLDGWDRAERVVLVDAVVTGAAPGTVHRLGPDELGSAPHTLATHDLGVVAALRLADALGRLPQRLEVLGIEGARFGVGDLPTPAVLAAVERVARQLTGSIRAEEPLEL